MSDFPPTRFNSDESEPQFERRRSTDAAIELLMHRVADMETRISERVSLLLEDFKKEIRKELHAEIKNLVPNGDIEAHRRTHECMIESANRWQRFRFSLFEHIAKMVGVALVVFISAAIWDALKRGVGQ